MPLIKISDLNGDCVFCYTKGTPLYTLTINTSGITEDVALPLKKSKGNPVTIQKAEDILNRECMSGEGVLTVRLGNKLYYTCKGFIFNEDKVPILVNCYSKTEESSSTIMCFDYSVIEYPEEPVNRFIVRKLIPFIVYEKENNPLRNDFRYTIMNCKSFIVKPVFQGELDHKLVGNYLAERILYELRDEPEKTK